jgi:cytochrome c556
MPRSIYATFAGLTVLCFAVMTLTVAMIAKGDDKQTAGNDQPVSFWMKKKLEYSQNILAGITNADFDKIVTNAESMRNLSKIEGFVRRQTPGYRAQLRIFEESADEILRQAKKDNVDGAALAFTQLTISCVNCHKHLRAEASGK